MSRGEEHHELCWWHFPVSGALSVSELSLQLRFGPIWCKRSAHSLENATQDGAGLGGQRAIVTFTEREDGASDHALVVTLHDGGNWVVFVRKERPMWHEENAGSILMQIWEFEYHPNF